jgi:methylmalonyl-CoA decarboxylase
MKKYIAENVINSVKYIFFNRNEKRNALCNHMAGEILDAISDAEEKKLRIIVIQANKAAKVFSSGFDLPELASFNKLDELTKCNLFNLFQKIRNLSIPAIVKVDGAVYGAALHLLMVCDIVIATESSTVCMSINKMGVPFDIENYQYWLETMGIHAAKELFMTAIAMEAGDAYNAGVFNHVVSASEIDAKLDKIILGILSCSPDGISNTKLNFNKIADSAAVKDIDLSILEASTRKLMKSSDLQHRIQRMASKFSKHI